MRVGIIGTKWGRMHVGAFRAAGAQVVALCGHDAERTRVIAAEEGIETAPTDVTALCQAVDVVVVASPDALHRAHVETALSFGRHVVCEKPLAMSLDEARVMCALAERSGRRCVVNFPYRQLPPLVALRSWLPEVRQLEVTLRSSFIGAVERTGDFGGMSHLIDAVLWLCRDEAETVSAVTSVNALSLQLMLRRGGVASLTHRPTVEPGVHGTWSMAGERVEAGFFAGYHPDSGGWRVSPPRACIDGLWRDVAPGIEPQAGHREPWADAHVAAARAFLAGEDSRLPGFRDGLRVHAVLDAALRSAASGARERVDPTGL